MQVLQQYKPTKTGAFVSARDLCFSDGYYEFWSAQHAAAGSKMLFHLCKSPAHSCEQEGPSENFVIVHVDRRVTYENDEYLKFP
eukprot:2657286-Karenia_brevis.AAC.1